MFKDLFSYATTDVLSLPLLSMLFFLAVFVVVIVRVCARSRRSHYDRMARLPLTDLDDPREASR